MSRYKFGKRHRNTLLVWLPILIVVAVVAAGGWLLLKHHSAKPAPVSLVPQNIARAVSFPIYYPNPTKLPAGYTLNLDSFSKPIKNGVLYSVSYGNGNKIVFSIQQKPSDTELQNFTANYIPLNNSLQTPVGQAKIGAYNNHGTLETLVSLPTKSKTWLVITAPYDTDQNQLKQILQAIGTSG